MERQHEESDEEEDDAESEMDSEDEPAYMKVVVDVQDFETGLRELEARGSPTSTLEDFHKVALIDSYEDNDDAETIGIGIVGPRSVRRQFARFVTLLDRYGRQRVRGVTFVSIRFDDPGLDFDEADLDRLFGQVLPTFPLLDRLRFEFGSFPAPRLLGLFASKLSAEARGGGAGAGAGRPLLGVLDMEDCTGDLASCVPEIAAMIRNNVPIRSLNLAPIQSLGRNECRQIFQGLQHNSNLCFLEVNVEEVYDDALILPKDPNSSLRYLSIYTREWSETAKSSFAQQLKTNTLLEDLRISDMSSRPPPNNRPWMDMLESYNYTLRFLFESSPSGGLMADERIAAYLRRNALINLVLGRLQEYHVSPTVLLPRVLHMVRTLPTLIYRFVRLGNVDALCDLLAARQQRGSGDAEGPTSEKRSCPTPFPRRSPRIARLRK